MAELEVKIQYKTLPAKVAVKTMFYTFPLWAVIVPACLGIFIGHVVVFPSTIPVLATIAICFLIAGIFFASLMTAAVAEDNKIHFSKDGLAFPLFMLPLLKFKRNRAWEELVRADLVGEAGSQQLVLAFSSGEVVPLRLDILEGKDVEQLLLAVELWGTKCNRTKLLVDYQQQLHNEAHGVSKGYTQMWEEELRRRFTNTAFVPLEPEQILCDGKLKIVRQLAFGGLSAIYLALHDNLDMVVLKEAVVPPNADPASRAQAEQYLVREAQFLSKLNHSNIARVLDHFVEQGRHYLMLEYFNGPDLRQYVKQHGVVSQVVALGWACEILKILCYLHEQQPPLIHRDLTPDNLVLTNDGKLILIDFGAANQFVGKATGTVVGKQAYIPPEQLRGKTVTQSDIYAFAGTLFFLMTGKDPMPLAPSRIKKVVAEADEELDGLIAKCSAFEVKDRFQTAEEVLDAIVPVLERLSKEPEGCAI